MSQSSATPVLFITGASTGFGREVAMQALKRGWRVAATARHPDSLKTLGTSPSDSFLALPLDVTNEAQIKDSVAQAAKHFGRIDALINNAGYGMMGAVEEFSSEEMRTQFETNVFGAHAVIRAVLPVMRQQKSGHIINLSSVVGFVSFAGSGAYAATKHALEGLSKALAAEVQPLGIKVTMINPGPFRTDFAGRSLQEVKAQIADYDGTAHARIKGMRKNVDGKQAGDPVRAAAAMLDIITMKQPPFTLPLGEMAYDAIRQQLKATLAELDQHEKLGRGTDFPKSEQAA